MIIKNYSINVGRSARSMRSVPLREQVDQTLNDQVGGSTHPLTQVVLISLRIIKK